MKWVEPMVGGGWRVHAVYYGDGDARDIVVECGVAVLGAGSLGNALGSNR